MVQPIFFLIQRECSIRFWEHGELTGFLVALIKPTWKMQIICPFLEMEGLEVVVGGEV
jgi:hypothetical protein